jgi:hypothetical protein
MAIDTFLIKTALRAIDNSLPFQELSLPWILDITGFHVEILLSQRKAQVINRKSVASASEDIQDPSCADLVHIYTHQTTLMEV